VVDEQSSAGVARFGFVSELAALLPFYVVCIFLSGWAYDDYYFRLFGIDPRFLDLGFHDTLVKGFTIIFSGAIWLVAPYAALACGPLLIARVRASSGKFLCMAALFAGCLLCVYLLSRSAGENAARIDQGDQSTLPDITFTSAKQGDLRGRLVFAKGDQYFVHRSRLLGEDKGGELQLSVYKASEIQGVLITEHQ
jgi:hypothetical protein